MIEVFKRALEPSLFLGECDLLSKSTMQIFIALVREVAAESNANVLATSCS